jgi:hypothetical protein
VRIRSSFATFPQIGATLRILNAWGLKDITPPSPHRSRQQGHRGDAQPFWPACSAIAGLPFAADVYGGAVITLAIGSLRATLRSTP